MADRLRNELTRRERQVMDVLFRLGEATAVEVQDRLPDAPTNPAVRSLLRILEEKGHVVHREEGPRYVYSPSVSRKDARRSALRHLVETFFDGSPGHAVATLIDETRNDLADDELERLEELIRRAREEEEEEEPDD